MPNSLFFSFMQNVMQLSKLLIYLHLLKLKFNNHTIMQLNLNVTIKLMIMIANL